MNIKNMKIALLLAGLVLVFGKKAEAGFYTTMRSTAVQVVVTSSFTQGVEALSIRWSSGSTAAFDQYIMVIDSDAVENDTSGLGQTLQGGTTLASVMHGKGRYPNENMLIPPITVFSTVTAGTNGQSNVYGLNNYLDLRDDEGCGIPANNGIEVLHINGAAAGTAVTIEWRPRPQSGPCRNQ